MLRSMLQLSLLGFAFVRPGTFSCDFEGAPLPSHELGTHRHVGTMIYTIHYTERSELVWIGVTGISLCTADGVAAGNGQRRIAMIQPHTFP